jgi:hypothetical protein
VAIGGPSGPSLTLYHKLYRSLLQAALLNPHLQPSTILSKAEAAIDARKLPAKLLEECKPTEASAGGLLMSGLGATLADATGCPAAGPDPAPVTFSTREFTRNVIVLEVTGEAASASHGFVVNCMCWLMCRENFS